MKAEASSPKARLSTVLRSQGPLLALLILLVVGCVAFPDFGTTQNFANVAKQSSMIGLVATGMAFVILSGGIDLSVGSTVALTALLAASLSGHSALAAVIVPILAGVGIGAVNGTLITRLGILPFTATLATMLGIRGLAYIFAKIAGENASIVGTSDGWFPWIARGAIDWTPPAIIIQLPRIVIPYAAIIFLVALAAAVIVSRYTSFGRSVYAVGGNEEAARMMGLKVRRCKMLVYMLCGGCAGAAGVLFASRMKSVNPDVAGGWELAAIAAVVISGVSLTGGTGKIGNVAYGVLILGIIPNFINELSIALPTDSGSPIFSAIFEFVDDHILQPTYSVDLITGILLLAVVLLQSQINKSESRQG